MSDVTLADVLAQTLRVADGEHTKGAGALGEDLARTVLAVLTSDRMREVVARVRERQYGSEYDASHLTWRDFLDVADEELAAIRTELEGARDE